MRDRTPEPSIHDRLAIACQERRITGPAVFHDRFGVPPGTLTPEAALTLLMTPDWVIDIWIEANDPTPCLGIPAAVRRYASVFGIEQEPDESFDAFDRRLCAALCRKNGAVHVANGNGASLRKERQ